MILLYTLVYIGFSELTFKKERMMLQSYLKKIRNLRNKTYRYI